MSKLYETDFYGWTQEQAQLIQNKRLDELDLDNILEELESMGRSDYRSLRSCSTELFMHLLQWQFQPNKREFGHSWEISITKQRARIRQLLEESPSLKSKLDEMIPRAYKDARKFAAKETRLPIETFPKQCPWDFGQAKDDDFWPE